MYSYNLWEQGNVCSKTYVDNINYIVQTQLRQNYSPVVAHESIQVNSAGYH